MGKFNDTKDAKVCSSVVTAQVLTLDADGFIHGGDVECRWAVIKVEAATALGGLPDVLTTGYPLLSTVLASALTLQISNTDCLYFKGTAGKKVYILSGS